MKISVISYNLLSDKLCTTDMFLNAKDDPEICNSTKRLNLVLQSFDVLDKKYIICLQEVSRNWSDLLTKYFYDRNYTYIPSLYGNYWNDYMGEAIAFSNEIYELHSCKIKKIGDLVPRKKKKSYSPSWICWMGKSLGRWIQSASVLITGYTIQSLRPYLEDLEESFLQRAAKVSNTLITLELSPNSNKEKFVVSNYHMPCKFQYPKVMLTHALLAAHYATNYKPSLPLILVGDFNIQPNQLVYNVLCNGWKEDLDSDEDLQFLKNLKIAGELKSAYHTVEGCEPPYTTQVLTKWNPTGFTATLDYIFHSKYLIPTNVLPVYSPPDFYFPNSKHPSDHLLIGATFQSLPEGI